MVAKILIHYSQNPDIYFILPLPPNPICSISQPLEGGAAICIVCGSDGPLLTVFHRIKGLGLQFFKDDSSVYKNN